jgi:sulfoxide reductase heme-binding subunit YedZ
MNEALWALGRGTGVVALVLLTVSLMLGVLTRSGRAPFGLPRFSVALLHRNASLLAGVFVVIHVVSLFFDSYAQLKLVDALVPFLGSYRPFWLGLGTVALDLMIAITVTALLRARLGRRVFRVVHWFGYAMWPVALFHSLFTGTDAATPWFLAIASLCTAAVVGSAGWRASRHFVELSDRREGVAR